MSVFTDDYNRASIGSNWANNTGTTIIDADQTRARPSTDGVDCVARVTAISPGTSQYAKIILTNITGDDMGPCVYLDTGGTYKGYGLTFSNSAGGLYRLNGTPTQLATFGAGANGDAIELEVSRVGNDNTLKCKKNGVQLGSDIVDTTAAITGGAVGTMGYAAAADTNSTSANSFEGGDSSPPPPTQMTGGVRSGRRG